MVGSRPSTEIRMNLARGSGAAAAEPRAATMTERQVNVRKNRRMVTAGERQTGLGRVSERASFILPAPDCSTFCHQVDNVGIGGVDETRTRDLRRDRPAF